MIKFLKVRDVKTPERGTELSSGIDFFVPSIKEIENDIKFTPLIGMDQNNCKIEFLNKEKDYIILKPGMGVMIPSGLKVKLPKGELGFTYEMSMHNKSGVAVKQGLVIGAQIIDNDYQGEFNLHLINTGNSSKVIKGQQKIVQGIVRKVYIGNIGTISEEEFNKNITERGEGGFGSTGV